MRTILTVLSAALFLASAAPTTQAGPIQADWSGGPGESGPVPAWSRGFDTAADISWRAVPGQVALSSTGLGAGVAHNIASFYSGAFGVEAVDIDHDGDVDVIGVAENARKVTVWYNDGQNPPSFTEDVIATVYVAAAAVVATDFNGDGLLDLVVSAGTITGKLTAFLNGGGSPVSWTSQLIDPQWGEAWEIGVADVDSDGNMDVVGTSLSQDSVVWWRNDGETPIGWTRLTVDAAFAAAHSARGADLDGDGHTDIVGCGTVSEEVAWWKNSGTQPITWTKYVMDAGFAGGRSVRIADIDDDGDPDVVAGGFNGRMKWWRNDGGTPVNWVAQVADSTMSTIHHVQIADMNGDGLLDLIGADYQGNALAWWQNGGGPSPTWTRYKPVYNLNRPLAVDVGDIDGDGALELIGSSNGFGQFVWYDVTEFVPEGILTSPILDRGADDPQEDVFLEIDWIADTPVGTDLRFQVRGGEDPGALGPWSADITVPGPLGSGFGRYIQYKAFLSTTDDTKSPVLKEVGFAAPVSGVPLGEPRFGLQTYPNPANPRVMVAFEMPAPGRARLEVFDTRGRHVRTLIDERLAAGPLELAWDGVDTRGRAVATGVYHVVLSHSQGVRNSRVTIIR
jgi:hypothetical protein